MFVQENIRSTVDPVKATTGNDRRETPLVSVLSFLNFLQNQNVNKRDERCVKGNKERLFILENPDTGSRSIKSKVYENIFLTIAMAGLF